MIEVSHLNEKESLTDLPQGGQETILGILQILDTEYGADRDKYKDDGVNAKTCLLEPFRNSI